MAEDYSKMKVADLKKLLKERNLSTTGNKNELVERLQLASGEVEDEEIDEAAILGGDEEDATKISPQEEESVLLGTASSPKKPGKKISLKRSNLAVPTKPEPSTNGTEAEEPAKKKIKLITEDIPDSSEKKQNGTTTTTTEEEKEKVPDAPAIDSTKSVISFSKTEETADAKKLARQMRFGITASGKSVSEEDIEKMKKRAERFGETTAPVLLKEMESEKMKKRAERFGEATGGAKTEEEAEKAKKRQERFGISADATVTNVDTSLDDEIKRLKRAKKFGTA